MDIDCVACGAKGAAVEAGHSLCLPHLHAWMLSKECATARRLYGTHSASPQTKREVQVAALMKLFLSQLEPWTTKSVGEVIHL